MFRADDAPLATPQARRPSPAPSMQVHSDNPFLFDLGVPAGPLGDVKRRLLKAFFDHAPMLMGVVEYADGEALHRAANQTAVRLFQESGAKVAEVDGVPMTELGFTEDEAAKWTARLEESAASGRPVHFETRFPWGSELGAPDGRELEVVVVRAGDDTPLFAYVSEDVTERRASERERERLARDVLEATTREQERMAQDLHDGLGQILNGAAFMIEAIRREAADRGDVDLAGRVDEVLGHIGGAQRQARAVAHGLFPIDVERDGLMSALQRLCAEAGAAYGLACDLVYDAPLAVGTLEGAGHAYRIVQEAISNAARHGHAEHVVVAVTHEAGGHVVLRVEDDGVGVPDESERGGGIGMRTMALRAEQLGGTLEVRALDGGGTAVSARFPEGGEVA